MSRDGGHPVFAWCYERMARAEERAGMAAIRRDLLAGATGRVLEIGAGTGLNFRHYPSAVTEVVATEPDPHMLRRARSGAGDAQGPVEVVQAAAESLPFDDDGFDTAVATLVLCNVQDPPAALGELRRVLRPGGRLLFFEHVRSERPAHARWQDRLERPWGWVAGGCHPNRDSVAALERAGYRLEGLRRFPFGPPSLTRPHVAGAATP